MKTIPLHEIHVKLGAKIVPFAGFQMPVRYSSDLEEHHTVRQGVGVFDVSHMGEFVVKGPGALALIQKISANDASMLFDGKVQYSYMPNATGGVVDDLLVYRYNEEEYYLVVNASNIEKDWDWIMSHNTEGVEMENISDRLCLLAVQGPKATATLQKLTDVVLADMDYYTFTKGRMAGIDDVLISATGYTGAGGFEIYVWADDAAAMWEAIFEAGAEFGIKPVGLGARDTLRLEKGYCLYGNDINDMTSPLEAGLGWVTKFTKDFVNSDALKAQKEAGLMRKLVGFELLQKGIPRGHYAICNEGGEIIGEVTSGTLSPTLQKGVGMGYVPIDFAKPGTEIFVQVREKLLKAQVVKMPFC
ncbi:glycine cleavage system aminomethyltransferase GcvT [Arundinibacter roseus]|uniref:Aminomethyltransferase n=1 Tax=Arundinibacter roseus TaxID=2070510 RepID=A0A4R4KDQ8_9BACT|nr:glycine cleavage system aminomethyltransferase GcvT [Arundinibacter roseus]TDB66050.1 glycine cleavage system aminomethyltransferase GcvT [Arundinibacter roseus]